MKPQPAPDPSTWLAHTRWVESLARSLVRDPDVAADLTQSTLLAALERAPSDAPNPRGWLARVLRNLAFERGRRESARETIERRGARVDRLPGPDDLVARAESERRVVEAVLALEEPHKSTLLLRYFEDLGPSEIAARSNTPLATVTSRITRAHARLRVELERRHGKREWMALLAPILERPRLSATEVVSMSTSIKLVSAALLVVAVAWWSWPRDSRTSDETVAAVERVETTRDANPSSPPTATPTTDETRTTVEDLESTAGELAEPTELPTETPAPVLATTGRIHGRVFRPDGQPAPHRKVRLIRMTTGPEKYASTDESGVFDERELGPGLWSLATWPDEKELETLGKSGERTLGGFVYMAQVSVDLAAGADVEVELGAPPKDGVRVHGRLLANSQAIEGVLTWLPDGRDAMDRQKLAVSDATRGYELTLEHAGRFTVVIIDGETRVECVVDVPLGAQFEHDFELPELELKGRVVDAEGQPVIGAKVELTPRGGHRPRHASASITYGRTTKTGGEFVFRRLPHARYALGVHHGTSGETKTAAAAQALADVDLVAGPLGSDLTIVLARGFSARGVITNDSGPRVGTYVFVFEDQGEPLNPLDGIGVDQEGAFELFALAPGRYWAVAARGDRWSELTRFEMRADGSFDPLELALRPAVRVSAEVPALEPAWVDIRDANNVCFSALLDKQAFNRAFQRDWSATSFTYFVPPGDYRIRIVGARGELSSSTLNAR